jgi:hypothetical protein
VLDLLHVVAAPSSVLVHEVVSDNLRHTDRRRWYPSILVEGYNEDREQQRLADDARGLGVPVVTTRPRYGRRGMDTVATFFDDWFFVRNTYASVVHVHATSASIQRSPTRWLSPLLRRVPVVSTVYPPDASDARTDVAIEVRRGGKRVARRTASVDEMRDPSWLYDAVLG